MLDGIVNSVFLGLLGLLAAIVVPCLLAAAAAGWALGRRQLRRKSALPPAAGSRDGGVEDLRTAMLDSVAHDLRAPLAAILGAATTLQELDEKLSSGQRRELAGAIADESRRLDVWLQNLLDMNRLDHAALHARAGRTDLREAAAAARTRLSAALEGREVSLHIPEEAAFVMADATLLEQILLNLLDNAIKHGRGHIEIAAVRANGAIMLSLTDDGPGVPEAARTRIFEPFQRAAAGVAGSGLGLSVAHGFAVAMNGTLTLDTRRGGGARFVLTLPCSPADEPGGAQAPALRHAS